MLSPQFECIVGAPIDTSSRDRRWIRAAISIGQRITVEVEQVAVSDRTSMSVSPLSSGLVEWDPCQLESSLAIDSRSSRNATASSY
ncbi:hypothetical protein CCHR01_19351 [Colletotrichum chrysophilum]|uniref:Uncharacterized protein n=1 Tax=Colletotrichum chrysophilum TaxID=1836956 RepID=A0AAD9A0R0_9PEZI|nr:hypothetical protein CCHR01_19351 [Colletotrichum chrysophilum]